MRAHTCESQVRVVGGQKTIFGTNVKMHKPARVHVMHTKRKLPTQVPRIGRRCVDKRVEAFCQVTILTVLQHQPMLLVVVRHFAHLDQACAGRVRQQSGCNARLSQRIFNGTMEPHCFPIAELDAHGIAGLDVNAARAAAED